MSARSTLRLMTAVTERLTEAMVNAGYSVSAPLDGTVETDTGSAPELRTLWFTLSDSGIAGMDAAITARIARDPGRVGIKGKAWVGSAALGQLAHTLQQDALDGPEIESVPFGYFDNPNDMNRELDIRSEVNVDYIVEKFMTFVHGPAAQWLAERDSLAKLFALAPQNNPRHVDLSSPGQSTNPDATRLRGVAVLGVENGRSDASAVLLQWYSKRTTFHHWDSARQVAAFDTALAQRYPVYARARADLDG